MSDKNINFPASDDALLACNMVIAFFYTGKNVHLHKKYIKKLMT